MDEPWYLHGLDRAQPTDSDWHVGHTAAAGSFRTPVLSTDRAREIAGNVRAAALETRRALNLDQVVVAVSRAAARLSDPDDPIGAAAAACLEAELGWSPAAAGEMLDEMGRIWTEDALWAVVRGEFEDPEVLDGFRSDPSPRQATGTAERRRRRAVGPPILLLVHAGNVPGVAVTATVRGLLVRSGVLSKTAESEPGLLPLFCRALDEEEPRLGATVAATWWPETTEAPAWGAWARAAGRVVVYGGDAAVRGIRAGVAPATELIVYGPKLGVGVLLADLASGRSAELSLEDGLLEAIAHDVCAYEQQGCVSPRVLYLVGASDAEAARFGERLGSALQAELERRPPPPPDPDAAVSIRSLRAEVEFRGYGSDPGERLFASPDDLAWTVIVSAEPRVESEGLPRVMRVHPIADLAALEGLLEPLAGRVQAIGYAGTERAAELAELAVRVGVARLAPFGRIAWPPADWRHDGRPQLLPLVSWTDWEEG